MKDELRRRISDAIDRPGGLSADAELTALLAADAEAARYAKTLAKLGDAMANWPISAPNDAAFEAIATRIEQRLTEELPHLADVTGLPEFDDDDALADATAALLGAGAVTSGEFELEDAESIPPPARPAPPKLVFPKPGAATVPKPGAVTMPKPGAVTMPKPGAVTMPKPGAAAPPPAAPPPAAPTAAAPPAAKAAIPPVARLRAVPPPKAALASKPSEDEGAARPPAPRGLFGAPVDAPKKVAPSIPPPEPVEAKAVEAREPAEPARDSMDELVPIDSKDVLLSGETLAAVVAADAPPPPPPSAAQPPAPPAPPSARKSSRPKALGQIQTKKIKKKPPAVVEVNEANDRFSFPSIPPATGGAPIMSLEAPKPEPEEKKKRGGAVGWMAGLAAAAAVGLAVFAGTNLMQSEPPGDAAAAALSGASAPAPAAPTAVAATPEAAEMAVADMPAETEAPGGYGGGDEGVIEAPLLGAGALAEASPSDRHADALGATGASAGPSSSGSRALRRATGAPAPAAAPVERSREELPSRVGRGGATASAPAGASGGGGAGGASARPAPSSSSGSASASPPPLPPPPRLSPEERAELPEHPTRGAVLAAVQSVEPAVRACGEDQHGVADVLIVVANSGRVTTATVSGMFAGTPVGSCVARAVRRARFPAFSADRFEFQYPFHL